MLKTKTSKTAGVYIFIDAANLWEVQKSKHYLLDYQKFIKYIRSLYPQKKNKVFYYEAYPVEGTRSYDTDSKHRFYKFLGKNLGFNVRKKPLKQINLYGESQVGVQEKGNMDVEITIDAMQHINKYDVALFLTGDSDFHPLMSYLKQKGKRIHVMSSKSSISKELREVADDYTDIVKVSGIWRGQLKHRRKK